MDDIADRRGFERVEVGTDPLRTNWINEDIFESLHFASLAVVDMTGRRLNCAIELGYALARGQPVILSARSDLGAPPFDVDKLPFFLWEPTRDVVNLRLAFEEWWTSALNRPPVVSTSRWLAPR